MDFIKIGTKIEVAAGSTSRPLVIRWTTWWGRNDLRQSYLLVTKDGGILVDPVKMPAQGLDHLGSFVDGFCAVVVTCPNHDRDAKWFGNQLKAPVLVPELSPPRLRKGTRVFSEGDLPGGLTAISPGHERGEMWLFWRTGRRRFLFCGDTIYGQTDRGGYAGYEPRWWMQSDGIRLYMPVSLSIEEMRNRYRPLLDIKPTEIFNGHNPRSISDPVSALTEVLNKGKHEIVKSGSTYLWCPR